MFQNSSTCEDSPSSWLFREGEHDVGHFRFVEEDSEKSVGWALTRRLGNASSFHSAVNANCILRENSCEMRKNFVKKSEVDKQSRRRSLRT